MKQVLITGASGYLGMRLARRYLEHTQDWLVLWLHARTEDGFRAKIAPLIPQFSPYQGRVTWAWGDLQEEHPFRQVDLQEIDAIVHAAAVTRFNVDWETARSVNVAGTVKLLAFAEQCPSLQAVGLLSTIYASGLRAGLIPEGPLEQPEAFANYYEESKWQAEKLLLEAYHTLPWRLLRVATAIADDQEGRVTQLNAFHNTLKLCRHGLLPLIPGRPDTPLYFVTGDWVAAAIVALMGHPVDQAIYHLCPAKKDSITLGDLMETAFEVFEKDEAFRARRILKPPFCDLDSFELLSSGASSLGSPVLGQVLASVSPFAPQLFVAKDVCNDRMASALTRCPLPDTGTLIANTCEHLARAH